MVLFCISAKSLARVPLRNVPNGRVSGSPAEGPTEEPGDEGPDGSDEEPVVGCQRHADTQEIMLRPFFYGDSSTGVMAASWKRPGEEGNVHFGSPALVLALHH